MAPGGPSVLLGWPTGGLLGPGGPAGALGWPGRHLACLRVVGKGAPPLVRLWVVIAKEKGGVRELFRINRLCCNVTCPKFIWVTSWFESSYVNLDRIRYRGWIKPRTGLK